MEINGREERTNVVQQLQSVLQPCGKQTNSDSKPNRGASNEFMFALFFQQHAQLRLLLLLLLWFFNVLNG